MFYTAQNDRAAAFFNFLAASTVLLAPDWAVCLPVIFAPCDFSSNPRFALAADALIFTTTGWVGTVIPGRTTTPLVSDTTVTTADDITTGSA